MENFYLLDIEINDTRYGIGAVYGPNNTSRDIFLRSGQFRGQKGLGPLKKPREMPHYMFCPRKKNNIPDFLNQRYINS